MKAIKQNKVYTITETEKSYYVAQGYDILNDEENKKLKAENKELKKSLV